MIDKARIILADWRLYVFGSIFLFILFYHVAFNPPRSFPTDAIVTIEKGESLASLSRYLEKQGVVKSPAWFRAAVITLGGERGVQAGDYYLGEPETAIHLAWRMVNGRRDLALVKVTIPEGHTVEEISELFDERFPFFNNDVFVQTADEGYLFPDTYFVQINATAGSAIELLEENFERKMEPLKAEIAASKHTEAEIIIMASILEAEVQTAEDMALVAGILWKRLSIGMPLQVDPAPETYKERGLPAKPLNNPGLTSIKAALNPTASPYLYFLSGKDGKTYYAKTLEEHTANIRKHL